MIARLQSAFRSRFFRSIALLSGGQSVAMLIPFLAAPILGRIYAPADYGFLALYMSVASLLGVMGTLQYQTAIIAEPSLRQARLLVYICVILGFGFMLLTLPIAAVAWATFLSEPVYIGARTWVFAIPATALAACFVAGTSAIANRHRRYRMLASVSVVSVCFSVGVSILCGLLGWGVHGLMLGYFSGQAAQVTMHALQWRGLMAGGPSPSPARLLVMARRHRNFPIFALPGAFLSNFNMQIPIFALGALGATQVLGQFSRARQLVSMPITLLGGAIAQVYRQEAAERYHATGNCQPLLLRTATVLFAMGILPCLVFMAIAPQLFSAYLGEQWYEAGDIARLLAPMLLFRLVVNPVSTILYIAKKQHVDLILSAFASLILIAISVAFISGLYSPTNYIITYSVSMATVYSAYFILSVKYSRV